MIYMKNFFLRIFIVILFFISSGFVYANGFSAFLKSPISFVFFKESVIGKQFAKQLLSRSVVKRSDVKKIYDLVQTSKNNSLEYRNLLKEVSAELNRVHKVFELRFPKWKSGRLNARHREFLRESFLTQSAGHLSKSKIQFLNSSAAEKIAEQITVGREFTAVTNSSRQVRPFDVLVEVQQIRGGEIKPFDGVPGKLYLTDSEGLVWGAEIDGVFADKGGLCQVIELQTPPLVGAQKKLLGIPLQVFNRLGLTPKYSVGGGHIHVDVANYFALNPSAFVSFINILLKYEDLLVYVFSNSKRAHAVRKLSSVKHAEGSLSDLLGGRLNYFIDIKDYDQMLLYLKSFIQDKIPHRNFGINFLSWSGSIRKSHGTLELRFFNAPQKIEEALLEEFLIRSIVEKSIVSSNNPVRFKSLVPEFIGENAYLNDAKLYEDFMLLLKDLNIEDQFYRFDRVFLRRVSERRHPGK